MCSLCDTDLSCWKLTKIRDIRRRQRIYYTSRSCLVSMITIFQQIRWKTRKGCKWFNIKFAKRRDIHNYILQSFELLASFWRILHRPYLSLITMQMVDTISSFILLAANIREILARNISDDGVINWEEVVPSHFVSQSRNSRPIKTLTVITTSYQIIDRFDEGDFNLKVGATAVLFGDYHNVSSFIANDIFFQAYDYLTAFHAHLWGSDEKDTTIKVTSWETKLSWAVTTPELLYILLSVLYFHSVMNQKTGGRTRSQNSRWLTRFQWWSSVFSPQ